ncbi:MAG: Crp/Fnr family transcriptional regulator [Comamonadaceae bacterium]|nr:MAG: Crp/Fnr family transcriptional regulator [Comamonadaceae bacterium]
MPIPVSALTHLPLLAHLPQVTVEHLAQHAQSQWFSKREVVLHKGHAPSHFCFLIEGRLQGVVYTHEGKDVGLYFVNPGDYFGDIAIVDNGPQPEFVTAVAKSLVVLIPRELIKPVLFAAPKIAEALCQRLALRIRVSAAQRSILGLPNPLQRVCAQLLLLLPPSMPSPPVIVNAPTHQELGIMINATRETVTRAFHLLLARGVVERDGNDLQILQFEFMSQMAQGKIDLNSTPPQPAAG